MNFLIAAVVIVLFIGLILAFRGPRKMKPAKGVEPEVPLPEAEVEAPAAREAAEPSVEGGGSAAGLEALVEAPEAEAEEAGEEGESAEESAVDVAVVVQEEELPPGSDEREMPEAAPGEEVEPPVAEEELEEETGSFSVERADEEVEQVKLETGPETDLVFDEKALEKEPEVEIPVALTLEKYEAELGALEAKIRQELEWAIKQQETIKRSLLEPKLQTVSEMQASLRESFARVNEVIEETGIIVQQVGEELPGFQSETAGQRLQNGDFEVVEALLAEASSQLDDDSGTAEKAYYARGLLMETLLEYFNAYENYRKAYAADNNNHAYLLAAGRMARILGNDQDAQFWLEKLVRRGIEKDEKSVDQSIAQHELGLVCVRANQKEKAGALFKRSIEIKELVLGQDHPGLGPVMHDYGVLFEGSGMYEQAEKLYKRSIEVTEKGLGEDHPRLGSTLNRLAGLYEEMEVGSRSEPLYRRSLAIKEKVFGAEHLDVGTILNHLAELLRRQGKLDEAEPLFKRSLQISEKELGLEHPNLTIILNNLAELYTEMGKEKEAEKYQERAFSLFDLPGGGEDFVEIEKDNDFDIDEDKDLSVT